MYEVYASVDPWFQVYSLCPKPMLCYDIIDMDGFSRRSRLDSLPDIPGYRSTHHMF